MSETIEARPAEQSVITCAAQIVASYVGNNTVASDELPDLIRLVHGALSGLGERVARLDEPKPAVPVTKSVSDTFLVCLEDGKKFKSLK